MIALLLTLILSVPGPTPEFVGAIVRARADQFHADQTIPPSWFLADGWSEWETDQVAVEALPPGPATVTAGPDGVPTPEQWAALRMCESSGRYTITNPSGKYRGAYQFDQATWESVGGVGDPAAASPAEQDLRASILYSSRGSQPWPECGRFLT